MLQIQSLKRTLLGLALLAPACVTGLMAQGTQFSATGSTAITTAVPFLTITPDARAGGMGDAGVASSPDANGAYWNVGKWPSKKRKGSSQ